MNASWMEATPDGVLIYVRLTPKAAHDSIDRVAPEADGRPRLRITVTTVPEKGKANASLAKLLAKKLRLPKTSIRLIAGDQARLKTLLITGDPASLIPDLTAGFAKLGLQV